MASASETVRFRSRDRVVAAVDLPGVPAGTPGRVVVPPVGFTWVRYRVRFENGVELGSLDGKYLEPAKRRRG
jgi:hypothetical protein